MICPECGKAGPEDAAECASCGVIFSKWKPRPPRTEAVPRSALRSALVISRIVTVVAGGSVILVYLVALIKGYSRDAFEPISGWQRFEERRL